MVEQLHVFFTVNEVIVHFVHGQVFFLLGVMMGVQWWQRSRLELSRALPWLALFGLLRVAVSAVMGLVIVHAVMSWVQARSPVADVLGRLAAPILRPVRRLLPPLGGVDLSPLVVLVLLQVLMMVLTHLQVSLWR